MGEVLQIDRIRCDGHGLCAELLPELISLDDWGYPIIKPGHIPPKTMSRPMKSASASGPSGSSGPSGGSGPAGIGRLASGGR